MPIQISLKEFTVLTVWEQDDQDLYTSCNLFDHVLNRCCTRSIHMGNPDFSVLQLGLLVISKHLQTLVSCQIHRMIYNKSTNQSTINKMYVICVKCWLLLMWKQKRIWTVGVGSAWGKCIAISAVRPAQFCSWCKCTILTAVCIGITTQEIKRTLHRK